MAISVANVRTQISDVPRTFPPAPNPPNVLGVADGVNTLFFLKHPNFVPGTLIIYTGVLSAGIVTWTAVASSAYTVGGTSTTGTTGPTQALITFNNPPAAGLNVGARYQAVAFSDADINGYITRSATYPDDRTTLKGVQYDMIDAILTDVDRLELLHFGDYQKDPRAVVQYLSKLKDQLANDVQGGITPGRLSPAYATAVRVVPPYQPRR